MHVDGEQQSTEKETGVADFGKAAGDKHDTLKYHLLGPSLTKAGQDSVDQQKVGLSQVLLELLLISGKGLRDHLQCFERLQVLQQRGIQGQEPDPED